MTTADLAAQKDLDAQARAFHRAADGLHQKLRRGQITPEDKLRETCHLISEACGEDPFTGAPRYTAVEVLGWFARAVEMGCEVPVVAARTVENLFTTRQVPNARFRERFLELAESEGLTAEALATRMGIMRKRTRPSGRVEQTGDATAVERILGITPREPRTSKKRDGDTFKSLRIFINYDQAVALAEALGLDYHTVGV